MANSKSNSKFETLFKFGSALGFAGLLGLKYLRKRTGLTHGHLLGTTACGVPGFNCNYDLFPDEDPSFDILHYIQDKRGNLQYAGTSFQCVEYARRWWIVKNDIYLPNVPCAYDIWDLPTCKRLSDNWRVPALKLANGKTTERPRTGDLLIWQESEEQPYGHVAVVVEVVDDHIRIAEQNYENDEHWGWGTYSRWFPLIHDPKTGFFKVHDIDDEELLGWVRLDEPNAFAPKAFAPPTEDRLPVNGVFDSTTILAMQHFLDAHFKNGQDSPVNDYALAIFLNTRFQNYAHIPMGSWRAQSFDRVPITKKLQCFLNAHPEVSGCSAGTASSIPETGVWCEATTRALQTLLNRVHDMNEFDEAVAYYRSR